MGALFSSTVPSTLLYMQGLTATSNGSPNSIFVNTGICRSSNDAMDLFLPNGGSIDCTKVGIGGLDQGTLQPNTPYIIGLIGQSNVGPASTGLLALSVFTTQSGIAIPAGYDSTRLLGLFMTDGSGNIISFNSVGGDTEKTFYFDSLFPVLTNGSATTPTAIDLSAFDFFLYPALLTLQVSFMSGSGSDNVVFSSTNTVPANPIKIQAFVPAATMINQIEIVATQAAIFYQNSGGGCSTSVSIYSYSVALAF